MLSTKATTTVLHEKLDFNIKLTVQEKLLLLSAIRENVARQLESAQTFHGEDFASSYYENIGKLTRIERALILSHPNDEIETGKKFDLFN